MNINAPIVSRAPGLNEQDRKRIWMIEAYWFFRRSCDHVREEFPNQFPNEPVPSNRVIEYNINKFHDHGTSLNISRGQSGRPFSVVTDENGSLVDRFFEENPTTSTRKAAQELSIPR